MKKKGKVSKLLQMRRERDEARREVKAQLAAYEANLAAKTQEAESARKFHADQEERRRQTRTAEDNQRVIDGLRAQVDLKDRMGLIACQERDRVVDLVKRFTSVSINGLDVRIVTAVASDSSPAPLRQN